MKDVYYIAYGVGGGRLPRAEHDTMTGAMVAARGGLSWFEAERLGARVTGPFCRFGREINVGEPPKPVFTNPLADIAAERARQQREEGWTPEHDDTHDAGQMACAAACYAINAAVPLVGRDTTARYWPWDMAWWKPTDQRRDLVKAGALIVAEIERLDRLDRAAARKGS